MKANTLSCEILIIFIIVFATLAQGGITRIVHGRPRGGLLGAPEVPVGARLPEEKWYELQSVDHFNGKDNRYWKQVTASGIKMLVGWFFLAHLSRRLHGSL